MIEALTEMRRQIYDNKSLPEDEKDRLLNEVSNEAIFGIDIGRDPNIARIARLNMYLHGDGGSCVYVTDALAPTPKPAPNDNSETQAEVEELEKILTKGMVFDVVLTNPPFSKTYKASVPEEQEVLDAYQLATYGGKASKSLRASVMFIERYWNLLRPGGRLLMVIDDEVLSGVAFGSIRRFIREKYIIRAIISLPGDAFQQVGSRAKTSILYMIKRKRDEESQPGIFVWECKYIGLDNLPPKTRPSTAKEAEEKTHQEIREILEAYDFYLNGRKGPWLLRPEHVKDRLDVKNLVPYSVESLEQDWSQAGADWDTLENIADPIEDRIAVDPKARYRYLKIQYDGEGGLPGETTLGSEITYSWVGKAKVGDIVISNINAVNGAVCVITKELTDLLISPMYTILRIKPTKTKQVDPVYLWKILHTPAIRAEWLSQATGVGRHPINWDDLKKQRIPLLSYSEQREIGNQYRTIWEYQDKIPQHVKRAGALLASLNLESQAAFERLQRAKPPK